MNLLFNDNDYVKDWLGFIDGDLQVKKIKNQVYSATKILKDLIGADVYAMSLSLVEKNDKSEEEAFLLYNIQSCILIDAYRHYVPSGDVSHTKNGRKMRVDSNEKQAFEWMLDRDDESQEKNYYKSLDILLDLLDEQNPVITVVENNEDIKWKDSEAFQKTHRLFVRSTADFEEYFSISSRLLLSKLQPALYRCERDLIKPRLNLTRLNELKEKRLKGEDLDEQLLALIQEACVYYALAWGLRRLRITMLPEGIVQQFKSDRASTKASAPPIKLEAELAAQSFDKDVENALKKLEDHLKPAVIISDRKISNEELFNLGDNNENDKFLNLS